MELAPRLPLIHLRRVLRAVHLLVAAMRLSRPELGDNEAQIYAASLNQMALRADIDPLLAVAIVHHESHWYPARVSEDGEDYGLGQVRARYLSPCREDEDPLWAPSEACQQAKQTMLVGTINLRRMGAIIEANKLLCKAKIGSDRDPHWLAGYQGLSRPAQNRWCQPGQVTRDVLDYYDGLLQRFALRRPPAPRSALELAFEAHFRRAAGPRAAAPSAPPAAAHEAPLAASPAPPARAAVRPSTPARRTTAARPKPR